MRTALQEGFLGGPSQGFNTKSRVWNRRDSLALTQRLCQPFFPVALGLLAPLDGHIQCTKVMLEFQVDCSLSGGEDDLLNDLAARDFIDLRDVL